VVPHWWDRSGWNAASKEQENNKMAANAPPHTIRSRELEHPSPNLKAGRGPAWSKVLSSEDPVAIWERLQVFVRSAITSRDANLDEVTQGFFLLLLATGRFDAYKEERFSEAEIESDLMSLFRLE
jgi:hypothetical protein